MKTCKQCHQEKKVSEFYRNRGTYQVNCKVCDKAHLYKLRDMNRFGTEREKILARYNHQCFVCGMTQIEHLNKWGRGLTIDHIDGNGRYAKDMNNDPENLQILCLSDHGKKDNRYTLPPRIYKASR